jgi:hypothetical protein
MDLERVEAVLEGVLGSDGSPRQLAGLPRCDEPAAEPAGQRAARDVAACLGAEHEVGLLRSRPVGDLVDGRAQRVRIGEQRHDVLEDDPRLGEVRDVPDLLREIDGHETRWRSARQNRS